MCIERRAKLYVVAIATIVRNNVPVCVDVRAACMCAVQVSFVIHISVTCEADWDRLCLDLGHVHVAEHIGNGGVRVLVKVKVAEPSRGDLA